MSPVRCLATTIGAVRGFGSFPKKLPPYFGATGKHYPSRVSPPTSTPQGSATILKVATFIYMHEKHYYRIIHTKEGKLDGYCFDCRRRIEVDLSTPKDDKKDKKE